MSDNADHLAQYQFQPGNTESGHGRKPRVRDKNLARTVRDEIEDGRLLVDIWVAIATDPLRRDADRLRATELLADRGFGKAANFAPQEGDPLGLEDLEQAAAEFTSRIDRLRAVPDDPGPVAGSGNGEDAGGDPELP